MYCHASGPSDCFSLLDNLLAFFLRGWQLVWSAYGFMDHFKASGMRKEAFMCCSPYNINCTITVNPIEAQSNHAINKQMERSTAANIR